MLFVRLASTYTYLSTVSGPHYILVAISTMGEGPRGKHCSAVFRRPPNATDEIVLHIPRLRRLHPREIGTKKVGHALFNMFTLNCCLRHR